MVTIIKVKRKITEDPADCLLIEFKKKKVDADNESIKQILKYAGTANSENDIPDKINELNKNLTKKDSLQNEFKSSKLKDIKENNLHENKKTTKSQRYILVNKKRGLNEKNDDINVIDVISTDYLNDDKTNDVQDKKETTKEEIMCNGTPLIKEKLNNLNNTNYIYDIYYAKNDDTYLDLLYANNYNIQLYSLDDANLGVNKNEDGNKDEYYEDEDDSNDENNWRNDYPDEENDDDNYYNEYDHDYDEYDYKLSSMMKKSCAIDNYDDDENDYYNDDGDAEDDEYNYESNRAYNNYKKKILQEFNEEDF